MRDAPGTEPRYGAHEFGAHEYGANEFSAKIQAPTPCRLLNFRRKFVAVRGVTHG